jgi:hypothetical protein
MPEINIAVDSPTIRKDNEPTPHATVALEARRTLDNNIMILDHEDIDIVVYPEQQKVLALATDELTDRVYETQDRLFKFLSKKGVVDVGTVHGGNVYGSMQAKMLESKIDGVDSTQMTVFSINKFLEEEKPYFMIAKAYRRAEEDRLTDPDDIDSTDLDEVPHEETKGSIDTAHAYGLGGSSPRTGRRQYV